MIRSTIIAASLIAMLGTPALAAPCRDARGKFTKCPTTAPAKATRCKDAKGKFAKCSMPGAKPA